MSSSARSTFWLAEIKKLGIILALAHEPKILILDEPTSGLDPIMQNVFYDLLKEEKASKVVDWDFLDRCYEDDYREFQYLVMDYLVTMQKYLTYDDVPKIFKYIKNLFHSNKK